MKSVHCFIILLILQAAHLASAEYQALSDADGRELEAKIVDSDGTTVSIVRKDGMRFELPIANLSTDSQKMIEAWLVSNGKVVFTAKEIEDFPYEVSFREVKKNYADSKSKIRIEKVRGTKPNFEKGGDYLMIGSLDSPRYEEEYLFFGVENGNDSDIRGYSRWHRPEQRDTKFKVGLHIKGAGRALVGTFSDATSSKWRHTLFLENS